MDLTLKKNERISFDHYITITSSQSKDTNLKDATRWANQRKALYKKKKKKK